MMQEKPKNKVQKISQLLKEYQQNNDLDNSMEQTQPKFFQNSFKQCINKQQKETQKRSTQNIIRISINSQASNNTNNLVQDQKNYSYQKKDTNQKNSQSELISLSQFEQSNIKKRIYNGQINTVKENLLPRKTKSITIRNGQRNQTQLQDIKKEKVFEIIKEKPKSSFKVINVPVERQIEKQNINDVIIEKSREKIRDILVPRTKLNPENVQTLIKKPYDKVKQNIIQNNCYIDIEEKDLNKYYDYYHEKLDQKVGCQNQTTQNEKPIYLENIKEKQIIIEVPKEKIKYKKVPKIIERPVKVEKIIEQIVEVPIEISVYKDKEIIIEKPIYKENIIEKLIPFETIIEKDIEVPVEHIIEVPKYIENIIEKKVQKIKEVPIKIEQYIEVPKNQYNKRLINVEKVELKQKEKIINTKVPFINQQTKLIEQNKLQHKFMEKVHPIFIDVNRYIENTIEEKIEIPCYETITKEVPIFKEKITEVPCVTEKQNLIFEEKVTEIKKNFEILIEKKVEFIIEKEVLIPVEKIFEVPLNIYIDVPIIKEVLIQEEVPIIVDKIELNPYNESYEQEEYENEILKEEIIKKQNQLQEEKYQNKIFQIQYQNLKSNLQKISQQVNSVDNFKLIELQAKYEELQKEEQNQKNFNRILKQKFLNRQTIIKEDICINKNVQEMKQKMKNLVIENHSLFDTSPAYSIPKSNKKSSSQNKTDLGPGQYNVPEINSIKQNTQNVVFGKSLRQNQKKLDIPGPGQYNTLGKSKVKGAYFTMKYNKIQNKKQLGPGSYDTSKNYNKAKGATFSTAKNQLNKYSNSPGPGSYYKPELYTDFKKNAQRGTFSYSPKIKGLKRNVPGPGQYQIVNQKKNQNQTFSKTSRNQLQNKQTPGYKYDTFINSLSNKGGYLSKQSYDIKKSKSQIPFYNNQSTYHKNFKNNQKVKFAKAKRQMDIGQKKNVPGVGQYNLQQSSSNKGYQFSGSFNKNQGNNIPGPGQYDNNLQSISKKGFKFNKFINNMKGKETPGPGSYNFFKTFKKNQTFGKQNKNLHKENQVPGPGAYQFELKEKIKMGVIPKDNHKEKNDDIPGPADYELPKMIPLVANYNLKM